MSKINFCLLMIWCHLSSGQELKNLAYCHENIDIGGILFLTTGEKVGFASDLTEVYLLNKSNMITDTLTLEAGDDFFQNGLQVGPDKVLIQSLHQALIIRIRDGQLHQVQSLPIDQLPYFFSANLPSNISVGWTRSTIRNKHPYIYHIYEGGLEVYQTPPIDNKTKFAGSGMRIGNIFYDWSDNKMFLPMESTSETLIYDFQNMRPGYLRLPPLDDKNSSWYVYYDHAQRRPYAVQFSKRSDNKVFRIMEDFQSLKLIATVSYRPSGFVDGHIHEIRKVKAEKGMTCHYLHPLHQYEADPIVLEEVTVSDH